MSKSRGQPLPLANRQYDAQNESSMRRTVEINIQDLYSQIGVLTETVEELSLVVANISTVRLDTNSVSGDAFGRLRVSTPETIFDSKLVNDDQSLFWDDQQRSGTATTAHSTNLAASTLGVSLNTAGNRTRQTFRRFNYQPGKGQLVLMTFVMDKTGGGAGITRSVGLFDDDNGIFLKDDEGDATIVVRSSTSGSAVDTEVIQRDWNIDPMDGTGVSGLAIDLTKAQILLIDFEWLGVGRVRVGFDVGGVTYYAHEFTHANVISTVFMSTPNLPLRYEIVNDGTGAASTMDCICSTVISEGGLNPTGQSRWVSTANTPVATTTENTIYAIIGIRLGSGFEGVQVDIMGVQVQLQSASDDIEWLLLFDPIIAVAPSWSTVTGGESAVEYFAGATANTLTGGYYMDGGYLATGTGGAASAGDGSLIKNNLKLGTSITGTAQTIVLAARPINGSNATSIEGGIHWRELL